jgi:hypothetical protein
VGVQAKCAQGKENASNEKAKIADSVEKVGTDLAMKLRAVTAVHDQDSRSVSGIWSRGLIRAIQLALSVDRPLH